MKNMFLSFSRTAYKASKKEFFAASFSFFVAFSVFLAVDSLSVAVVSQVEREARPALGADVAVRSRYPLTGEQEKKVFALCESRSAVCSRKVEFSSALIDSSGKASLVRVVGAEPWYPYYGEFEVAPVHKSGSAALTKKSVEQGFPSDAGFLAEPSVITRFASGGILPFFGKDFRAEGAVSKTPDAGFSFGDDNGTIVVSYAAALAVPEIRTLSRADFSILAKTRTDAEADALASELKESFQGTDVRVRSFRWGAGGAARVVDDVSEYVSEALSVVFFLSATAAFFFSRAVWISNRRYFSVLRILGASRLSVSAAFAAFFLAAAFLAGIAALAVSAAAFSFVPFPPDFGNPSVGWEEIFRLVAALPFVLVPAIVPGVVSAYKTAPLSGLGEPKLSLPKRSDAIFASFTAFAGAAAFLAIVSDFPVMEAMKKSAAVVGSISAVLALSYVSIRTVARFFRKASAGNFAFFDAVRLSLSPGSPAFPVVSAFVVPAVLFASFASLAFHFSSELQRLSASGYDVFALNLQPKDVDSVRAEFPKSEAYSVIRARISRINGKTLPEHLKGEPPREFTREFNVTTSALPESVIEGADRPVGKGEVSLDREFADELGIGVGDNVTFSVMGREFDLVAVSVRESVREGLRPFFYFQVAPGEFSDVPLTYFVAAQTSDAEFFKSETVRLSGSYVSFVDVRQSVAIVQNAAERILPAVWAFLSAIAVLSVTVAVAALSSLRHFRNAREKTYRAMGASREFLRKHAFHTLLFYAASAFVTAAVAAFPAVWGGIASVSFLEFSFPAAAKAMGVLFVFLLFAVSAVAAYERKA